jgi:glycosyltransferase involved in cell wall biosynthesis
MINKSKAFPLITVGLTCYNAELTIIGAINSCFNQNWPNIEVIVVDDFSTDSSVKKIKNHINGKNVKFIIHKENKRYAGSINTIINNASGDFITIFDHDDFSIKSRINLQYNRLIKYEKTKKTKKVLCYGYRSIVKVNETKIDHIAKSIGGTPTEPFGNSVANYFLRINKDQKYEWGDGILGSCTILGRTENFKKFYFDENFKRAAEIDFAIRASLDGYHFISVTTPIIKMQKTLSSYKSPKIDYINWRKVYMNHKEYLISQKSLYTSLLKLKASYYKRKNKIFYYYLLKFISVAIKYFNKIFI